MFPASNLNFKDIHSGISSISQSYQPTSMRTVLSGLRRFLSFIWMSGETASDLSVTVPGSGCRKVAVVPTLSVDEEKKLLQSIDRSTQRSKRNYAMILLAIRTGLRQSDIINLKLTEIDWRNNAINIIQKKNGRALSLPLLPDVGNALADYILYARPISNEPYIFLKIIPPFTKLTDCYSVSRHALDKAGLRQEAGQYKGFHIFRHSVASRMLQGETPLSVISNTLGHGSMESSKMYLTTDSEHLKVCALTLEGIEVSKEAML
ncbi:MAG: tyrosine-type recombinase/integrase [Flexilinea sp.]